MTRSDLGGTTRLEDLHRVLAARGHVVPVFALDAREPAQVRTLLGALIALVEARARVAALPMQARGATV